jgi:hypothetical protein
MLKKSKTKSNPKIDIAENKSFGFFYTAKSRAVNESRLSSKASHSESL